MAFKDTEDGINEKGWERAMSKLPPARGKVQKFTIEREPKTKDIKIKLFPNQREALKTTRAINKLKDLKSKLSESDTELRDLERKHNSGDLSELDREKLLAAKKRAGEFELRKQSPHKVISKEELLRRGGIEAKKERPWTSVIDSPIRTRRIQNIRDRRDQQQIEIAKRAFMLPSNNKQKEIEGHRSKIDKLRRSSKILKAAEKLGATKVPRLKENQSFGEDTIKDQAQKLHQQIRSLPFGKEKENAFQKLVVLAKQRLSSGNLNTKA